MPDRNVMEVEQVPVGILAGGAGVHLGPGGETIPKAMVEVDGEPILAHLLRHFGAAGFRRFVVCAGFGRPSIEAYVRERLAADVPRSTEWEIAVVDTGVPNRTGSRLMQARPLLEAAPRFFLTYADTLSDVDPRDLLAFHRSHGKAGTLLAVHNPTRFRILGLVEDDAAIRGFSDKPVLEKDYINGGFYVFERGIFSVGALSADERCTLENEVLEELVARKELCALRYDGFWQPVDNERDRRALALRVGDLRRRAGNADDGERA